MNAEISVSKEIAFYYPNPFWYSGDWVKNLILFFDGIALLVPDYMKERLDNYDPAIAEGLRQHSLLHILKPETVVDKSATEKLATAMTDVITSGVLDPLTNQETTFHELSYSRLGGYGDQGLAEMIFEELKERGLARDTEDGVSIPMHPMVRSLVLVLLAQILRSKGNDLDAKLSPATDRSDIVNALCEILSAPKLPSSGNVISFDLETVGVDLGAVPMEEILDFRRQNLPAHKNYIRSVRRFVRELSLMPEEMREQAFADRQEEINDLALDLRRVSRNAWKKPASFAITIAGAVWSTVSGDPIGVILGSSAGLLGLDSDKKEYAGAYSYLFRAAQYA